MSAKQAGAASLGMASENFGYSRVRLRRVKKLQFGVIDPNELVRRTKLGVLLLLLLLRKSSSTVNQQQCAHDLFILFDVILLHFRNEIVND